MIYQKNRKSFKIKLAHLYFLFFSYALIYSEQSYSKLGETSNSVEADAIAFFGSENQIADFTSYTVRQITNGIGSIREYISTQDEIIFAVTWNGLYHLDIRQLLDTFHKEIYDKELSQSIKSLGTRHRQIKKDHLIVENWGNTRNLQGRAYDPYHIPSGVTADAIQ
jgi:hypothetical protein